MKPLALLQTNVDFVLKTHTSFDFLQTSHTSPNKL